MKIENCKLKIKIGFTLLEMLVVIGIIAILVTIGFGIGFFIGLWKKDLIKKSPGN